MSNESDQLYVLAVFGGIPLLFTNDIYAGCIPMFLLEEYIQGCIGDTSTYLSNGKYFDQM